MGSWAEGVESVQGSDRGEYLPFGTHDVEGIYGAAIKKRDGSGILIKARVRILASNVTKCKPLDEFDICINVQPHIPDNWKLQVADVRGLLAAAYEVDIKEVDEPAMLFAFPEQATRDSKKGDAIKDRKFRCVAQNISKDKNKGGEFTKYICSPFDAAAHDKLKTAPKAA